MAQKTAATYHGAGTCQKGCCWTPYGTCAAGWTCDHHAEAAREEGRRAAHAVWAEDMVRAARVAAQRNRVRTSRVGVRR